MIAIRAYQALAAKNHEIAVYFMEGALKLAKPEGFMRIFIDIGVDLIPYLQEAARCGVEPGYVGQILSAIQDEKGYETPVSSLTEPLSERELEVLRLVVAGLSNREIAKDLVISLGTAKTHIHNIYGKLEVKQPGAGHRPRPGILNSDFRSKVERLSETFRLIFTQT